MDDAYVQVQHTGCGAVYAAAIELKNLIVGLRRDAIPYRVDANWITQAQVDQSQQEFTNQQRGNEDQKALDKQREADRHKKAEEQQKALREQYGKLAEAAAAAIANEVKAYLETGGKDPNLADYPEFAKWYSSRLLDHWELLSSNSELFDYGQVTWKERTLEAVFGKVTIKLKNAVLGEYVDGCFLFGHVIDDEFGVFRDPIELSCADSGSFASWKSGHSFQSQWVVQ